MRPPPIWDPTPAFKSALLIYGIAVAILAALAGCAHPPDGPRPPCTVYYSRWEPDVYIPPDLRGRCSGGIVLKEITDPDYNP